LIYHSFGVSIASARAPIAFIGSLFLLLPWLYRRYFSPKTVLMLTAAAAVSPSLVYWSRFVREDTFVLLGIFISVSAVLLARPQQKALLFALGLAIQFCSKESVYLNLAILAGYLLFELFYDLLFLKERTCLLRSLFAHLRAYPIHAALAFG